MKAIRRYTWRRIATQNLPLPPSFLTGERTSKREPMNAQHLYTWRRPTRISQQLLSCLTTVRTSKRKLTRIA